jgi:hypothetical protein
MTVRAAPRLFSPYEKPQAYRARIVNCQYFLGVGQRCCTVSARMILHRAQTAYQRIPSASSRLRQEHDIRTAGTGVRDIEAVVRVDEILRAGHDVLSVGSLHGCYGRLRSEEAAEVAITHKARQYGDPRGDVSGHFVVLTLAIRRLSVAISYQANPLLSLYRPISAACNYSVTPMIDRWSLRYLVELTD